MGMKFSNKLSLTILVTGLIVLIMSSFTLYNLGYNTIINSQFMYTQSIADEISDDINFLLYEKVKTAQTLANTPIIKNALETSNLSYSDLSAEKRKEFIKRLNERWTSTKDPADNFIRRFTDNKASTFLKNQQAILKGEYGEIFLTNKFGALVASTAKLSTLAHRHKYWWLGSYNNGEGAIFFDDRGYDDSVGGYVLGLVVPIRKGTEIIGVLKCNLNILGSISELISGDKNQTIGKLKLVRSGGMIVFEEGFEPLSTQVHGSIFEELKSKKSGTFIINDSGEKYIIGCSEIELTKDGEGYGFGGTFESIDHKKGNTGESWFIVCSRQMSIALMPITQSIKTMILIGTAMILILVLVAYLFGRKIAKPLAMLNKATEKIGKGDFKYRIGVRGKDEFGNLAQSFNSMASKLQLTTTSLELLEDEVKQRRQIEEGLKESENKYRQIFETNMAVKLMIDPENGAILEANEAACKYYGYSKGELETLKISDINALPPEKVHVEMQKAKSEERLCFNFPHRLASGEIRNVEVYSGPVNLGGKTLLYSIIHDVTDRIEAENKIRENEARYRLLFNSGNDAVFVHQPDADGKPGRFIEANEVACQMYGYTRDEFLRLTPLDLVISEGEPYVREKARNVLSGKQRVFENTHKRKTGEEIPVEISPHLLDLDGRPTILSRVRDITEHKRSEKERQSLLARLQQAEKMESVGTLAGGIAHDFNNILAVILGNTELASIDVPDSNPATKSLKAIHQASLRAKDMVQQLLAFSRKSDEKSRRFNMSTIVKESMKMLRSAIPTSIEFKQHISEDSCSIMGDVTQINQIVMNLVTNASHAMSEEGGLLELTLENITLQEEKPCFDWVLSPGEYVRLNVRDTGEGIEPKIIDRIFEPYFTTKEVGKGTGMGLSVLHGIVKRHGGGIRVESELGKGSLFEVYFPALETATVEEEEPAGKIKGGFERILFVDDEESLVSLNRQRLERLGYNVKSTTKPVEALEWFKADPDQFDVIITDMTMPQMTGDRLTAEVLRIRPKMSVIICTGYSERMSAKKAEAFGVRKYIEKPIALRNLASALRDVLDGK
jgi:PAS domain S-box-containing protein